MSLRTNVKQSQKDVYKTKSSFKEYIFIDCFVAKLLAMTGKGRENAVIASKAKQSI